MTCCILLAAFLGGLPGVIRYRSRKSAQAISWTLLEKKHP